MGHQITGRPTDQDEFYTYDGLNRLKNMDRGALGGSHPSFTAPASPAAERDYALSATGNWSGYVEKASGSETLNQTREHNLANEIADTSGDSDAITQTAGPAWLDPAHDAAGNMTLAPRPGDEADSAEALVLVYDAWGRLVKAYVDADSDRTADVGELLTTHTYDGLNRRIRKAIEGEADVTTDYYYNTSWQVLEERLDGSAAAVQYVWDLRHIDAPVLRDRDSDADAQTGGLGKSGSGLDERLFQRRSQEPTRGRVASENEMSARKNDDAMPVGIARSFDAVAARFRRNPQGRAAFAPGRRCSASTTLAGRRRPLALAGSDIRAVAARVGFEIVSHCTDGNFNVTALVSSAGAVAERCTYDPYGRATVRDGSWTVIAWANSKANEVLFCGYRHEPETGLYHVRNRFHHLTLGRWVQRDPKDQGKAGGGYHDGMSVYQYVGSRPLGSLDSQGLEEYETWTEWECIRWFRSSKEMKAVFDAHFKARKAYRTAVDMRKKMQDAVTQANRKMRRMRNDISNEIRNGGYTISDKRWKEYQKQLAPIRKRWQNATNMVLFLDRVIKAIPESSRGARRLNHFRAFMARYGCASKCVRQQAKIGWSDRAGILSGMQNFGKLVNALSEVLDTINVDVPIDCDGTGALGTIEGFDSSLETLFLKTTHRIVLIEHRLSGDVPRIAAEPIGEWERLVYMSGEPR